ncbi:MAG: metallophosphoesterase, partial [Burkholderiales bacterium]|nr:metallophosphoesterase [Burkholderiales bacterium]
GTARAIMGNHELNAIAWVTPKPGGKPDEFLKAGKDYKRPAHQAFLSAVVEGSAKHMEYVDWFKTLPLFLDLGEIRVVHAWWYPPHIALAIDRVGKEGRLNEELLYAAHDRTSDEYKAVQEMCKGMEADLPVGCKFFDKDGVPHGNVRLKWWDTFARSFKDAAIGPPTAIEMVPEVPLSEGLLPGLDSEVPVFIGHYWFTSEPAPLTEKLACLDYAAAVGDRPLMAYRWDGEKILDKSGFVGSH